MFHRGMRITKASFTERHAYIGANDLFGHVRVGHHDCLIEYDGKVNRGAADLIVRAPAGMCFSLGTLTAKFNSLSALQEGLKGVSLSRVA